CIHLKPPSDDKPRPKMGNWATPCILRISAHKLKSAQTVVGEKVLKNHRSYYRLRASNRLRNFLPLRYPERGSVLENTKYSQCALCFSMLRCRFSGRS